VSQGTVEAVNQEAVDDPVNMVPCKENGWQAAHTQPTGRVVGIVLFAMQPTSALGWISPVLLILALLAARAEAVPVTVPTQRLPRIPTSFISQGPPHRAEVRKTLPSTLTRTAVRPEFELHKRQQALEYYVPEKRGGMTAHKVSLIQSESFTETLIKQLAAE